MAGHLEPAYKANIKEITDRMKGLGLSVPRLASRSDVDEKTIRRLLKGGRSYASTFRDLAKILATEDTCHLLMLTDPQSQPGGTDEGDIAYLTCTIKLELRGKKKPEESQISIALMSIAEAIKQKGIVFVNETKAGSILATLCFSDEDDFHALVREFCRGALYESGIVTLDVPTTINVTPDIHFLFATLGPRLQRQFEWSLEQFYSLDISPSLPPISVPPTRNDAPEMRLSLSTPRRGVLRMELRPLWADQTGIAANSSNP